MADQEVAAMISNQWKAGVLLVMAGTAIGAESDLGVVEVIGQRQPVAAGLLGVLQADSARRAPHRQPATPIQGHRPYFVPRTR
jgi:hypothetical protein